MRQIFIFTADDKKARVHLTDSILNPVSFDWMQEALGQEQTGYYRSLMPDQTGFNAWGAVPGPVNQRTWTTIQVGDLVLTVYANQYHSLSTVIGKLHNQPLASRIWGNNDKGKTLENRVRKKMRYTTDSRTSERSKLAVFRNQNLECSKAAIFRDSVSYLSSAILFSFGVAGHQLDTTLSLLKRASRKVSRA